MPATRAARRSSASTSSTFRIAPTLRGVEFHHGLFYDQTVGDGRFDLVTMWHFLEHDYDPLRSLGHARRALAPDGRLVVEVPRLDSLTFRMFKRPLAGPAGTAAHGALRPGHARRPHRAAGFEVVDYLPYGAFPPYFYLFCGIAFRLQRDGPEPRPGDLPLLRRADSAASRCCRF